MKPKRVEEINRTAIDLLRAIQCEEVGDVVPAGWLTSEQLATAGGVSVNTMRRRLKEALKRGCVERRAFRVAMGGRAYPVPHFKVS